MATAGSGRATCEIGGSGEEFCTSSSRPELNEEPLNVSQEEAGQNVVEEQIDFHNAYKVSTIGTGQAPIQDSKLINNNTTCLPITSKASLSHPATMENLPYDVLSNIFMRLLAKQLAQMRSVSKSWNALLSQPSFIKSHLNQSIHNNDQILLVFYHSVCSSDFKPFSAHLSRSPHFQLTEFNKLVPVNPISGCTNGIRIVGAVSGLICSSYGNSVIHLWNPSLSAVSTLPPYPMRYHHSYEVNLRFGFDPKANDYKVIKLIGKNHVVTLYDIISKEWLQIGVYSMRKGSWELINQRFPSHIKGISDGYNVCLDGHDGILHWVGSCFRERKYTKTLVAFDLGSHTFRERKYTKTLVAFDLGSHTFREMPLPHYVTGYNWGNVLGVLGEKLCATSWVGDDTYEVWVMEEYGVAESWVKRHVFSQFTVDTYPFGFTSDNKFLVDDHSRLVLYDSIANETKFFDNFCNGRRHHPQKIVEYVDSLVWVAPTEGEMVDGAGQS